MDAADRHQHRPRRHRHECPGRDFLVTGEAVNLAARLQQAAEPGEILVGERTFRAVEPLARTVAPRSLRVKGRAGPITAYAVERMAPVGSYRRRRRAFGPFVGREAELTLMRSLVERAVEHARAAPDHDRRRAGHRQEPPARGGRRRAAPVGRAAGRVGRPLPALRRGGAVRAAARRAPAGGDRAHRGRAGRGHRARHRVPARPRPRRDRRVDRRAAAHGVEPPPAPTASADELERDPQSGHDAWRQLLAGDGRAPADAARDRGRALGRAGAARARLLGHPHRRAGAARGAVPRPRRPARAASRLGVGHARRDDGDALGARRRADAPAGDGARRRARRRGGAGGRQPVLPRGDPGDDGRGRRPRARDGAGRDRGPDRPAPARHQAGAAAGGGDRPPVHPGPAGGAAPAGPTSAAPCAGWPSAA